MWNTRWVIGFIFGSGRHRQTSVAGARCAKLAKRFYGPFQVIERIGAVAYKLDWTYLLFLEFTHCSFLKLHRGDNPILCALESDGLVFLFVQVQCWCWRFSPAQWIKSQPPLAIESGSAARREYYIAAWEWVHALLVTVAIESALDAIRVLGVTAVE